MSRSEWLLRAHTISDRTLTLADAEKSLTETISCAAERKAAVRSACSDLRNLDV